MKFTITAILLTLFVQCYSQSIVFPGFHPNEYGIYQVNVSLGSQPFGFVIPGNNYDKEAQTIFNRMVIQPADTLKNFISQFIVMLRDSAGISSINYGNGFDFIYWLSAQDSTDSKLNWCGDTNNITTFNKSTFTALKGWLTGSASYLNTHYNPVQDGKSYTQNSASIGFYSQTNAAAATEVDIGNFNGTSGTNICTNYSGIGLLCRTNQSTSFQTIGQNGSGFYFNNRTGATASEYFKNSTSLGTSVISSVSLTNFEIYVGCWNNSGTADLFSRKQYSFVISGKGFTALQERGIYNSIQWFMTKIGANV